YTATIHHRAYLALHNHPLENLLEDVTRQDVLNQTQKFEQFVQMLHPSYSVAVQNLAYVQAELFGSFLVLIRTPQQNSTVLWCSDEIGAKLQLAKSYLLLDLRMYRHLQPYKAYPIK